MNCIKDKFLQDLPDNRWYPPINLCDCQKEDNSSEFNGLQKVILEKNLQLRVNHCGRPEKYNLLNQDSFLTENTIYIVQYDFDLNGGIIRIPRNCTIIFYGGSIANGTILLDNTSIYPILDLDKFLFCRVSGTYKKGQLKSDGNGIYYWDGSEWKEVTGGSSTVPGKEYKSGVGITIEDDTINLNTASPFTLGGIRTGFSEEGNNYAVQLDVNGNAYVNVPKEQDDTVFSFQSHVFKRGETIPSTPTGGSYNNPVPDGWSDGIPEGTEKVWISIRTFKSKNDTSSWSTPVLLADSPDMDICFSNRESKPNFPTTHGEQTGEWHNIAQTDDIWMAISLYSMGKWGPWQITKIKGEKGADGKDGKDGKALNIVGEYKDTNSELAYIEEGSNIFDHEKFDITKVYPANTEIKIGDCLKIVGGNYSEHIIYCMDNSPYYIWVDLGNIEGAATYIHIKFSDDGGKTFTAQDGETPGAYIGFKSDNEITPSRLNVDDYKPWVPFKGNDGFGYWYIYSIADPELINRELNWYKNEFFYDDSTGNFTDENGVYWSDEPQELKPGEYQYMSFIKEPLSSNKKWSTPKLWNTYPANYTLTISNKDSAILDLDKPEGLIQNKEISWKLYLNGEEVSNYSNYIFYILINNVTQGSVSNNVWNLRGVRLNQAHIPVIKIVAYKVTNSGTVEICSSELSIPIKGKDGESKESTGFKVVLSNDIGVIACKSDGESLNTTSTTISAYFNEQLLTTDQYNITIPGNFTRTGEQVVSGQYSVTLSTLSTNKMYSLRVNKLYSNNTTESIPFTITYNGIAYSKSFELFKDYTGDTYELEVEPKVLVDSNEVHVGVFKTYSRETRENTYEEVSSEDNLGLTIEYQDLNDVTQTPNKFPITITVKPDSYIYLKENDKIIDREKVTKINLGEASQGLQGCVLRFRGSYKSGERYINQLNDTSGSATTIRWIDYVEYNGNYYLVTPITNGAHEVTSTPETQGDWIQAESIDFAYIKTLIADYISTTSLQAHQILVTRGNNVVAGMHQGNQTLDKSDNTILWAGTEIKNDQGNSQLNVLDAPFQVKEDGTLISTKAEVTGNITADSFITGSESNYGICVITGRFSSENKNTKKAYFAFDGKTVNMYIYYDGEWHCLDFSKCMTSTFNVLYTFTGTDNLSRTEHVYIIQDGQYKKADGGQILSNASYYEYDNTEYLILWNRQETEPKSFAIVPVEFYKKLNIYEGKATSTGEYKLVTLGKIEYSSGQWNVSSQNVYFAVNIGNTQKGAGNNYYYFDNINNQGSEINPSSTVDTIYYIYYDNTDIQDSVLYSCYRNKSIINTQQFIPKPHNG